MLNEHKIQTEIFTKNGELLPYYEGRYASGKITKTEIDFYRNRLAGKIEEISLIVSLKKEGNGETLARINCPINPLPVKGWFKIASKSALFGFLEKDGWNMIAEQRHIKNARNISQRL